VVEPGQRSAVAFLLFALMTVLTAGMMRWARKRGVS
jgi:hypothetical protein